MRHSVPERSLLQDLHAAAQLPAGLVCAALVMAIVAVAARIAAVW